MRLGTHLLRSQNTDECHNREWRQATGSANFLVREYCAGVSDTAADAWSWPVLAACKSSSIALDFDLYTHA